MAYHKLDYGFILVALLTVAFLAPALFLNRVEASQPWWNTSWQYRKAVAITSAASLSNYDVLVTVDTQTLIAAGKMKSDGSDIRFVDSSNAALSYWIESPTVNTATTRIWVNATSISTSGTTVWMYYGNPSATAVSNGASTFSFFDDDWASISGQGYNPVHTATQSWWESTCSYPEVFYDTSFSGRGPYQMLYDGHNGPPGNAKGYAYSPDLIHWTEYNAGSPHPPNPNPILALGYTGNSACAWGDPIKVGSTYYLFYSAGPGTTYRAQSTDLITWTNLTPLNGSPSTISTGAAVLKQGDGITPIVVNGKYWMVYFIAFAQGSMYLASSTDLLNWTPWSGNPLLSPTSGGFDSGGLWTPSFVMLNNVYYIYYEAYNSSLGYTTGYAKANAYNAGNPITPDMATWTKSSDAVLKHGSSGSWDDGYCIDPIIREFNGVYYVFYTGNSANGFATSTSPDGPWTKYNAPTGAVWTKGGSPTISEGIVTLGSSSSLISTSTYLYSAVGFRANFVGSAQKSKWAGFIQGSALDRTMIGTTTTDSLLYLKNYVSSEATAQLSGVTLSNFHVYEVLWRNAKSMGVVDHGAITATLTTQVPTKALPVTFYNYNDGTYSLQVDWVFVRPYSDPEPTTSVGSEETANTAPIIDIYSPVSSTLSISEGQILQFTQTSHDPDGDPLTYAWMLDSVVKVATQNWIYVTDQSSVGTHNVTVLVSDPGGLSASHQWDVTVVSTAIYVDPALTEKTTSDIGSTFNVNVTITGFTDLRGFDFNLTWDNSLITLAGVEFNATLDSIWGSGNWYCAKNESGAGYYKLTAVSTAGSYSGTGPTTLSRLTFTVQDPQSNSVRQTSIHFDTHKMSDSQYDSIQHTATDGTYRITGKTPSIQLSPTSKTCRKYGETFTVQVTSSDAYDVTDFEFEIHYNTTLLDYSSVTWNAWGSGTLIVDEVGGNVTGVTSGAPVGGIQTLVTIQFSAAYHHIWKDENMVSGWKNNQNGLIYIQWANLSYASSPDLGYVRGGSHNQLNAGPDVTYTFSPIQGDVDNNGKVDVFDLRTAAAFYDTTNVDYDLTGDNTVDIFDLVIIAVNYGFTYP